MAVRHTLPLILALIATGAAAQQPPPTPSAPPGPEAAPEIMVKGLAPVSVTPIPGPSDFISPMGEPFRSEDKLSGGEHWFAHTDTNHDGRITRAEFRADALRFFATLDTDQDGVIGPAELQHYETEVAPEVTVVSTYGDISKAKQDSDGKITDPPYPTRLGAARFSFLTIPEPVAYADTNLDRGVTRLEFLQAADKRFKALDANGDGVLVRAELPKLGSPNDSYR